MLQDYYEKEKHREFTKVNIVEGQGQEEEEKVAGDQAAMSNRLVESC